MKSFYEAPKAEELLIATESVMLISLGVDQAKDDLDWDLL